MRIFVVPIVLLVVGDSFTHGHFHHDDDHVLNDDEENHNNFFSGTVGHHHAFEKACTKHEDCKGKIPEEWCYGKGSDGGKKCVIMPPIKQTCEKDSDCPTKGNVCYSKRCVEPAHFVGYFNDFPRATIFSDIPPIQNCTASIECKNFPREWCINNHCVWKPPGRFHANPDLCTVMQMCKPGDICKFGRCVLPPRRPVHQHEDFAAFEKSCTKHEDCKGKIPEEWCHGKGSDGGKKCVIMPPIKQTCEKDSDCPTKGNVCYSKRCVEPAFSMKEYFSEAIFGNRGDDFGNLGDRGYPRNFIPGRRPCTETADCGPIQTCIRGYCKEQF